MITFMFGVLSSVIFWSLFLTAGFFIATVLLRHMAQKTFKVITTGENDYNLQIIDVFCMVFGIYLFWPLILIFYAFKFIVLKVFWNLFCAGIKCVNELIPEIEIKKKGERDE